MVDSRRTLIATVERFILGLSVFVASYGLLKSSGLFTLLPGGLIRALHETPPQGALYCLVIAAAVRIALERFTRERVLVLLFWAGVLTMAAGLVVSSFMRFEGTFVLTEGQEFTGTQEEFIAGSYYVGSRVKEPGFRLVMQTVSPRISRSGFTVERIKAQAAYQRGSNNAETISIDSALPSFHDGKFFRATRFGYSPRYRVLDSAGRNLEEGFMSLDLFPPGNEDSILSWDIPYTYYVKYFPEGLREKSGDPKNEQQGQGPTFRIRVMRNLDLITTGTVGLHEPIRFDSMILSIEEVRTWAEISVVKDEGMMIFIAGCIIAIIAGAIHYRRSRNDGGSVVDRSEGSAT